MRYLSDLFSSKVRSEILRLLFTRRATELHMREIVRRSGLSLGTVQQDLKKLVKMDLILSRPDGNRVVFQANPDHPLYRDLCNIVDKTVGLVPLLRARLLPLKEKREIEFAFVYGSIAKGTEKALSDVDLMVVGTQGLRGVSGILSGIVDKVGREVNPHTMTRDEFRKRVKEKDHFLTQVLREPKTFIVGGEHDLENLAR